MVTRWSAWKGILKPYLPCSFSVPLSSLNIWQKGWKQESPLTPTKAAVPSILSSSYQNSCSGESLSALHTQGQWPSASASLLMGKHAREKAGPAPVVTVSCPRCPFNACSGDIRLLARNWRGLLTSYPRCWKNPRFRFIWGPPSPAALPTLQKDSQKEPSDTL